MEGTDILVTAAYIGAQGGSAGYKCYNITGIPSPGMRIRAGEAAKIFARTCTVVTARGGEKLKGYVAIAYTDPYTGVTGVANGTFLKSVTN